MSEHLLKSFAAYLCEMRELTHKGRISPRHSWDRMQAKGVFWIPEPGCGFHLHWLETAEVLNRDGARVWN